MAPPPTHTGRDLVTAALKRLGVIAGTETPGPDLVVDGLDRLNSLLETWATESLVVWAQRLVATTPGPLPAQPGYTVGPGGDVVLEVRPAALDHVTLLMADGFEHPLTPLARAQWDAERTKGLTGPLPSSYFYNPTVPLGLLILWPGYSGGDVQALRIYVPYPLDQVTLDTVLVLPGGYYRALRDSLAVELVPEFPGRALDPLLLKIATDAKAQLERVNHEPHTLSGFGCGGHYNWLTDEVV